MTTSQAPKERNKFYIAFICALPLEYDAATLLLDRSYTNEGIDFGRAAGDQNHYTTGCISGRDVVIVCLPYMGTTSAASVASGLRSSFNNLKLAFIVGVCGGVPQVPGKRDAFLGDVVVSNQVVQTDSGRLYTDGFQARTDIEDILGRTSRDIRGLLTQFESEERKKILMVKSTSYLEKLQRKAADDREASYERPDPSSDILFAPRYVHKHYDNCIDCAASPGASCNAARSDSCEDLGCSKAEIIARSRPKTPAWREFGVSFGRIGSGNYVMKSGADRDRLAALHKLVAFEMEGAGVWDELPCIVVKGICDYADSHKNKKWQVFAASTAAAVAKALLESYVLDDSLQNERVDASPGSQRATRQDGSQQHPPGSRVISGNTFGDNARVNQGNIWSTDR